MIHYGLFILFLITDNSLSQDLSPIIDLPNGKIRGSTLTTSKNTKYYAFQGIPYAAPPIGDLRFEPPTAPSNWEGILNTTAVPGICHQLQQYGRRRSAPVPQTEDCLFINVFTPKSSISGDKKLSVMFWIYGGGFASGYSLLYDPRYFMDYEVIVVTFHYRVGIYGFLSTEDLVQPGNSGLKDQIFALKWVKQNIHLFGGDPNKVTIFGESAGAVSVSYLLLSQQSKDLFRASISQSGTSLNIYSLQKTPLKYAYQTANYVNPNLNRKEQNTTELVRFLKSLSAEELNSASQKVFDEFGNDHIYLLESFVFTPVIEPEHEGAIITNNMYELLENGKALQVPQIIGFNSEEAIGQAQNEENFNKILSNWDDNVSTLVPLSMNITDDEKKIWVGKIIGQFYCEKALFKNCTTGGVRYFSDSSMIRPVIETGKLQSRYSNVYFYVFSYEGPLGQSNFSLDGLHGVGHFADVFYMFKVGEINLSDYPAKDIQTHERVLSMWTNFAKTLNPTPNKFENITWPTMQNGYLNIGDNLTIEPFPRLQSFGFWESMFASFGNPPFTTY